MNCRPTFYKIIKQKSVEEFKPDPYIATVLNCAFWVFYGMPFVHPNSLLVVTINGVGLVFEFVYLAIFSSMQPTKDGCVCFLFHYISFHSFMHISPHFILSHNVFCKIEVCLNRFLIIVSNLFKVCFSA